MTFLNRIKQAVFNKNSCVSVGLDADLNKIPSCLKQPDKSTADIIFNFNQAIIDNTHDLVCAYKPNIAFYEAQGPDGLSALKRTVDYIKQIDPEIVTIVDAKRADIGNTNQAYAQAIFDYFQFDALTVHPYLGQQALAPLLNRKDKGVIVLCRTSNQGAGEFQDLEIDSRHGRLPLYQFLAQQVVQNWNQHQNCGLVVGATYPQELAEVRAIAADLPLLIPGIGAQGGDVEKTVAAGHAKTWPGMVINSARSIIFASSDQNFAQAARDKTIQLKQLTNNYLKT